MTPLPSRSCTSWLEIADALDSFPHQKLGIVEEPDGGYGGIGESLWVFRGSRNAGWELKPSIEQETDQKTDYWDTFESKILEEFQSRARMHLSPSDIPSAGPGEKLSWLSLMRHYGVPTRLLDFTLSPYVGLYFAIANRTNEEREKKYQPEIWAVDAVSLMKVARKISQEADRHEAEEKRKRGNPEMVAKARGASLVYFATDGDYLESDAKADAQMVSRALSAVDFRRNHFIEKGFVAVAIPPIQNRRLSSQQGVFLFNGALDLKFHESLFRMMGGSNDDWYRRFKIVGNETHFMEIERQLFNRNIHHLSLFPDIEGLAGFIRQKARLHWVPTDRPLLERS